MDFSINQFTDAVKNAGWFHNDIVLNKTHEGITSQFFHSKSSVTASAETNSKTMAAFHDALAREYGIFGAEAFRAKLQTRYDNGQSLRKEDILSTVKLAKESFERNVSATRAIADEAIHTILENDRGFSDLPFFTKKAVRTKALVLLDNEMKNPERAARFMTEAKNDVKDGDFMKFLRAKLEALRNQAVEEMDEDEGDDDLNLSGYSEISEVDPEDNSAFLREVKDMVERDEVREKRRRGENLGFTADDFEIVREEDINAMQWDDEHPHARGGIFDDSFED